MAEVRVSLGNVHPQADARRLDYFKDQHGRVWWAQCEKKTGDPVESPNPFRWNAPQTPDYLRKMFRPPEQYVKVVRTPGQPVAILVDYDQWRSDWHDHYGRWDQARHDIIQKATDGHDVVKQMENPSPYLRRIVGPSPYPPLEVIERMSEGDAWALGFVPEVPAWFTQQLHDEIVNTARANRLFSPSALRKLGKATRAELRGQPALVKNPKVRRKQETLDQMTRDELVEIAEAFGVPTSQKGNAELVADILAAYGTPRSSP